MAERTYPLLRSRRKRARRLPFGGRRVRLAAILMLCACLVVVGVALLLRRAPPDPAKRLADSQKTLAMGNYSAAKSNALAALSADPKLAAAHLALARAELELGEGIAAEGELTRAVGFGVPRDAVHAAMAQARLLQGDVTGAIAAAARAGPADAAYAERVHARALAVSGDLPGAERLFAAVLATDPRDARAWTDLGRARLSIGDVAGASAAAARAVALTPREPAALTLEGEIVRGRYGLEAALPWFEAALRTDAYYYPALIAYAATLGDAGRSADMLAATRAAMAVRPGDAQALYLQAVMAARAGRYDLSRRLLLMTGGVIGDVPGVLLLGGALDYAGGAYQQAATKWTRLAEEQPLSIAARRLAAAAAARAGDVQGALALLKPVATRSDADSYSLLLAARALEASGDRPDAARLIDRAMTGAGASRAFATDAERGALTAEAAAAPNDPTYALGVIRAAIGAGDQAGALAKARSLVAASPGAPPALLALGDVLTLAGRTDDATAAYRRAADLRFDEPTLLRLVDSLVRAGRAADAAGVLSLYLSQNPESLVARRLLGDWQLAAGQADAAVETLEAVRARTGNHDARLLADLALAYAASGSGAVARSYGREAYAMLPMSAEVVDAYGVALAADGDGAGARQLLDKAVAIAPGNRAIAGHRAELGR